MDEELHIKNLGDIKTLYIKETRRHFLKPDYAYISTYSIDKEEPIVIIHFKAAWGIETETLSEISKKYNIDFKIYAFETGMEFNQDIEIVKGKIIKDKEITFNNYAWECINPIMGG